jgi:hypothetical protein
MKKFNQITGMLIGLPTQLIVKDKLISFTANTKILENGRVLKAPIVVEISKIKGFAITEKKICRARKNVEFIDGKTQEIVWQMMKYTVK